MPHCWGTWQAALCNVPVPLGYRRKPCQFLPPSTCSCCSVSSWWNPLFASRCCWVLWESVRKKKVSLWLVAWCAVSLDTCLPSSEQLHSQTVPADDMLGIAMVCRLWSSGWIWVLTGARRIGSQPWFWRCLHFSVHLTNKCSSSGH